MSAVFIKNDVYRSIMENMPICTVDVLFFDKDKKRVLLFKRENKPLKGTYFSTGGRILKNERIIDCAKRKVLEEVSLKIDEAMLIKGGVQDEINDESIFPGVNYHAVCVFFGYVLESEKQIKLDNQHTDYKWFDIQDATLHPWIKTKIKQFIDNLWLN